MIVFSGLSHFVFGYHYTPRVAKNFSDDITIFQEKLESGTVLLVSQDNQDLDFYRLLERHNNFTVLTELPETINDTKIAVLGETIDREDLALKQIITSSKTRNSDRLYIYEKVIPAEKTEEEKGE